MKLRSILLTIPILALTPCKAGAELATFEWARLLTSPDTEHRVIDGIADNSGNVIVAHRPGLFTVSGARDMGYYLSNAVAKVDAAGNPGWTHQRLPYIRRLGADALGGIYAAGALLSNTVMRLPLTNYLTTAKLAYEGEGNAYVAKLSPSGEVEWVRVLGGSSVMVASAVAVDSGGNYHVSGYYSSGAATLGTHVLPATSPVKARNLFVAKFAASGQALWVRVGVGTTDGVNDTRLALDASGNVLLSVSAYSAPLSFESGETTDGGDFVMKLDPDGKPLWILHGGSTMDVDGAGNVFRAFARFDEVNRGYEIVLDKLSPEGTRLWSRTNWLGWDQGYGLHLGVDRAGNAVLAGFFGALNVSDAIVPGEITFGDVTLQTMALVEMYVAKYDSSGQVRWATQSDGWEPMWIGDAPSRWSSTMPRFAFIGPAGNVFVGGDMRGTVQFGSTVLDGGGYLGPSASPSAVLLASIPDPESNRPALSISQGGSGLQLSWPASFGGYQLESADSPLASEWTTVPEATVTEGDQNVMIIEMGNGAKFFRLRKL